MATQEKLLKSLEALKALSSATITPGDVVRKKEKAHNCHVITEAISNSTIKVAPNFHNYLSMTIEALLNLCDDDESDIRMTAEECLNRIIRAMNDGNIGKVQIELHKGVKRNGAVKSLRMALWKFAQLAHFIRPHKGKPYVVNSFPTLIKISERKEEQVHETLAASLPKIMQALGCFASDNEMKTLLKAFIKNVSNQSATIRRTSATCIVNICLNCRKPDVLISYVITCLLELLVPVNENHSNALILGVLTNFKILLPHLDHSDSHDLQANFGVRSKENEAAPLSTDRLLQIYELCLHYLTHKDHNVINAALEALNVLLSNCPADLKKILESPSGVCKSRIFLTPTTSQLKLRSPSQLSVATNLTSDDIFSENELTDTIRTDIEKWIDESKLTVINVHCPSKSKEIEKSISLDSKSTSIDFEFDTFDYKLNEFADVKNLADIERLTLSENSSEKSISYVDDNEKQEFVEQIVDIGNFLDKEISVVYTTRLLTKNFLLSGEIGACISDKTVRISVKSLALACLTSIVRIFPKSLLLYLDKNCDSKSKNISCQQISDIFLFATHADPQLRGLIRVLIANFLKQVLILNNGDFDNWLKENAVVKDLSCFDLENIVQLFIKGLEDESSTCTKHTLISLSTCLEILAESNRSFNIKPILTVLPYLASNPYWLIKVTLCDLVTKIPYVTIHHITGNNNFQNRIIHNVLFVILGSDDVRVRNAAANAILSIIPFLYHEEYQKSPILAKALTHKDFYLSHLSCVDEQSNYYTTRLKENMPFPFHTAEKESERIGFTLSKIIGKLYKNFLNSTSKYLRYGCIETLSILSETYPTTLYRKAWNCSKDFENSTDLLNMSINLLKHSVTTYDLTNHSNLLKLSANLYAGHAVSLLKAVPEVDDNTPLWVMFENTVLQNLSEEFLVHLVRLLNIFHHVLDEVPLVSQQTKAVLSNFATVNTLSPIKRRKSDLDKKLISPGRTAEKDDNTVGAFAQLPHYVRVYEILKSAYTNYKISLDSEACEKFSELLRQTLKSFSIVMEVGSLVEFRRIADEILGYFKSTFILEPEATVESVQQLLKCLFGTNLAANISEMKEEEKTILENADKQKHIKRCEICKQSNKKSSFYYNIYHEPLVNFRCLVASLDEVTESDSVVSDNTVMGYLHRKTKPFSTLNKSLDKILANYIRIFEPMVIKSLKEYTITNNVRLQCRVLQMLSQLIQLRVNYCLLDSEQVFIGFVLKQFEYIEEGQVLSSELLIPKIFQFLVQLSYSKQHSKSIISIPKIIQLCDGLMASGQSPVTHCIPALEPIIEDIFLTRNKSNTFDLAELETTREVLLAMLLRLSEYHQVLDLIVLILDDSKYCSDNPEKWLRWSSKIYVAILRLLQNNRIKVDSIEAFKALRRIVFALNPEVFTNVDGLILLLFQDPPQTSFFNRWLAKILIALLVLSSMKDTDLAPKIEALKGNFDASLIFENISMRTDPLNVTNSADIFAGVSPETILCRFLFRVVALVLEKCVENGVTEDTFLITEFTLLLMNVTHFFQSVNFNHFSKNAVENVTKNIKLNVLNEQFLRLARYYPILLAEWCSILTLNYYIDEKFWSKLMPANLSNESKNLCVNLKIVEYCSTIAYCQFVELEYYFYGNDLNWFFPNSIVLLINLSEEDPIFWFFTTFLELFSDIIIKNIAAKCSNINDEVFMSKLMKCLENTHKDNIGPLLKLLLPKHLVTKQLAVSRLVANLASRKIELLLTMTMENVNKQLTKEDLLQIIKQLIALNLVKKHETLSSLLNKLCTQYYEISPLEFDQRRAINPENIKKMHINKSWYLTQIRGKGKESAELICKLNLDEMMNLMADSSFDKTSIQHFIRMGVNLIKRDNLNEEPPIIKASLNCILREIEKTCDSLPKHHQIYNVQGRIASNFEANYSNEFNKLLGDEKFYTDFASLVNPVACYIENLKEIPNTKIPEGSCENFVKFSITCLEFTNYLIEVEKFYLHINLVDQALNAANVILKESYLCGILSIENHISWLCSAVNSLYRIVDYLLIDTDPLTQLPKYCLNKDESAGHACHQLYILVSWLFKVKKCVLNIPNFLARSLKSLIISMSRLSLVNSYMLIPQKVWTTGWEPEMTGKFHTQVPPLPIDFLQEIDVLEEFIFRITLLGWTTRQQFEENWMSLLSVLCNSSDDINEMNDLIHASSLAVKAITTLLIDTLKTKPGNTNSSTLIHMSRDTPIPDDRLHLKILRKLHNEIEFRHRENIHVTKLVNIFSCRSFERFDDCYNYSQMSIKYFLIATKIIEIDDPVTIIWKQRLLNLEAAGLDINSCLQFLLDFYTQLMKPQSNTQLRLLHEAVRSIVIISDLFTDKAQFQWMLEVFLELSDLHAVEDELLHQYLVVGVCKAAAVLTPDLEVFECIKKLLVTYLKSSFLPSRIACLHGILYILEGCKLSNIKIGGISEEMQVMLPCAVEYVQCQLNPSNSVLKRSLEHTLLVWAIAFFLIENIDENHLEINFITNTLQTVFSTLRQNPNLILQTALLKGLERLILVKRNLSEKIYKQVLNLALEKLKNTNPAVSILGEQLLLSFMYTDCAVHLENRGKSETNPDNLVQTIENLSAIFEHIKKGYGFEIEIICYILPNILNDFFSPSDILTKVIGEFLSPQQTNPKLLSRVVFKIFEKAIEQNQISLLQDWVVFSLPNLTQSLSLGMATWCLTCFFVSASTNEWLRAFFPYIQTRVGRFEYEDRKMLCIAGSDFYKNLTDDKQKETFIENFNKVKDQVNSLFNDLLKSL